MNILIKNALAVLPDLTAKKTDVCIGGGFIVSVGQVPEGFVPDETIDGSDRLLTPGLVNAHAHAYMTVLRNRADDLDFDTWLFGRVMPAEESLTSDEAYYSSLLGCAEMLSFGVTSYLDMHMFPGAAVRAPLDSGIRAVISRGLSGGGDDIPGGVRRLREAKTEIEEFSGLDRISFMIAPHALYTCSEEYMREAAETAQELGIGIHTHISEAAGEGAGCAERFGCTPVELYDRCGLLGEKTVAAHCVHISDSDIEILARRGVSVAINSASNLKLGNGFAPVEKLLSAGVNLALGTDSTASNNNLSILREMQLVSLIHKGLGGDPTLVSARDAFKMATAGGAKALGFGDTLGKIEAGAKADLALFPTDIPSMMPLTDPVSALSYSSCGLRADTVIVNGDIVLKDGKPTKIDTERLFFEINKITEKLNARDR